MEIKYLNKKLIDKEVAKIFIDKVKEDPKCVLGETENLTLTLLMNLHLLYN